MRRGLKDAALWTEALALLGANLDSDGISVDDINNISTGCPPVSNTKRKILQDAAFASSPNADQTGIMSLKKSRGEGRGLGGEGRGLGKSNACVEMLQHIDSHRLLPPILTLKILKLNNSPATELGSAKVSVIDNSYKVLF